MTSNEGIILYIWPGHWELPSFEPLCLAAVLYLQLAIPGKFSISETANPDTSPSGQLPYLVHDQHVVSSLPSIIKYVSDLRNAEYTKYPNANLDLRLSSTQKSQRSAWFSHAQNKLGDLVAHSLYSAHDNWEKMTSGSLASMYPVPQRYFVPSRIRNGYYHKLNAAGLWSVWLNQDGKASEKPFPKEKKTELRGIKKSTEVAQAFEREKVLEKARAELDIYRSLLGDELHVFQDQPTSVDLLIASHLLLLVRPPYPDPLLKNLILDSYPTLSACANRIYDLAFDAESPEIKLISTTFSFRALLPSLPTRHALKRAPNTEDVHFRRMRWAFFGIVAGTFAAYLAVVSKDLEIKVVMLDEDVEESEDPEEAKSKPKEGEKEM